MARDPCRPNKCAAPGNRQSVPVRRRAAGLPDRAPLERIRASEDDRFAARTPRSRALLERSRQSMPAGVPMAWMAGLYRHHPIFAARGEGACFEDIDGNRYLDMNLAELAGSLGFAP